MKSSHTKHQNPCHSKFNLPFLDAIKR